MLGHTSPPWGRLTEYLLVGLLPHQLKAVWGPGWAPSCTHAQYLACDLDALESNRVFSSSFPYSA